MRQKYISILIILILSTFSHGKDSTKTDSKFLTWLKGSPSSPYKLSWGLDISMATTSLTLLILSNFYEPDYTSYSCDDLAQCSENDVNAFDRSAIGPLNYTLDTWSDVTNILIANGMWLMLSGKESRQDFSKVIVMYLQLLGMTPVIEQWVQPAIGRERPYFYCDKEEDKARLSPGAQSSFPSSHANFAFAFAVLTSTVYQTYYPDSPWRFAVWSLSLGTASTTCLLRYYAHKHFPTDLLAGAATGTLMGWFVHFTHKKRKKRNATIEPVIGRHVGIRLKFSFSGS
jgi:membrane-associated phospholipid phosphatase